MIIPKVHLSEGYIIAELEEIEREDNFRLKRFKELKNKKSKKHAGPICPECKLAIDESNICTCEIPLEKQQYITCPLCDANVEITKELECICKQKEEIQEASEKSISQKQESVCTCDNAVGDVMDLCPCAQETVKKEISLSKNKPLASKTNKSETWTRSSQKMCSCEKIGEKIQNTKTQPDLKFQTNKLPEQECSCERIGDKKANVKVIKDVSESPEKSCCCVTTDEPKIDLEDVRKLIGAEKINNLKDIVIQKSIKEPSKVTFNKTSDKSDCMSCKSDNTKTIKSDVNKNTDSTGQLKICSKCTQEKGSDKNDSKNVTIHIIIGPENKDGERDVTKAQESAKKSRFIEVPQNVQNADDSADLGTFVSEFKEVVTIKRFKNEDGTIREEKQVVTMKSEGKNTDSASEINGIKKHSCSTPEKAQIKQKGSTSSSQLEKVKIAAPIDSKKSKGSCKSKSGVSSAAESNLSIEQVQCCSMGAQTAEVEKSTTNSCCKTNVKNKANASTSVTSSLSGKSSRACLQHSSRKDINSDRPKSCCTIKIVAKPKNAKSQDKVLTDNCVDLIKKLLLEANQSKASCQSNMTKSKSDGCACKSKKDTKDLKSSTSQTSNNSCGSTTTEKRCACGKEKAGPKPKPCEKNTCIHKTNASSSDYCKCKSKTSVSIKSDKMSQCSSNTSVKGCEESSCVHRKKESQSSCMCKSNSADKSVQFNAKESSTDSACKGQSQVKMEVCPSCGSRVPSKSTPSNLTNKSSECSCAPKPTPSIKSTCKETPSKESLCSCKSKDEIRPKKVDDKSDCNKGSKRSISFSPAPKSSICSCSKTPSKPASTCCKDSSSTNSFEKSRDTQTDCPKCAKAAAKESSSSKTQAKSPSLRSKTTSSCCKVEEKNSCSCKKETKPEPKCPICAKQSPKKIEPKCSCTSKSDTSIQSRTSTGSRNATKSDSLCSVCSKKKEPSCSCGGKSRSDAKSVSSNFSSTKSTGTDKMCPKCSQNDEIRTIKAPSQKSSCSCQTPKDNECCGKRSKSSVQFLESEICPMCEPRSKDMGTSTRRSDRYDVRNFGMLKNAEAPKKTTCTCSSDTYVGLDKWYENTPRASSYHGQCYH
ncbi:unnamed protein product [Leptosia nina]|uniref:Uncharacterized protein n=1 Tax=Leptosia nina TaxID=320188 RepID=A0AAV1JJ48_9NEOP